MSGQGGTIGAACLQWLPLMSMRRFVLPGAFVAIAVAFLAVLIVGLSSSDASGLTAEVQAGKQPPAPDARLMLPLLSGTAQRKLADYRGHYVMINFFAGWCDACQGDAGDVAMAQRLLAKKGGKVVGVTFQDSSSDAQSYMSRYRLNFPVLHDSAGSLARAYDVTGVPETFIINPQGKVVADRTCELTSGWVIKTLNRVLDQHQSTAGLQEAGCQADESSS